MKSILGRHPTRQRCTAPTCRRKTLVPRATIQNSSDASVADGGQSGRIKVPMSELPPPSNPKALQSLNKLSTKEGIPRLLGESLLGTSITIIGDDTMLNTAVGRELASKIGWCPTPTRAILSGLKVPLQGDELIEGEASVLKGLRDQRRLVVSTMQGGAASQQSTYRDLWGSIIVRVDEDDKHAPKPTTSERACHAAMAEVELIIRPKKGFGPKPPFNTPTEKAKSEMTALLKHLTTLLQQQPELVQKKRQYSELGFRGDWPELQPSSWNPVVDRLGRKPLPPSGE